MGAFPPHDFPRPIESYSRLMADGYPLTREQIDRDVERMFSGNFRQWVGLAENR